MCLTQAGVWFTIVSVAQKGNPTSALIANDASKSSLKQIWRPWDWRQPGDVNYAVAFLANPGRIASMMNGKIITVYPNSMSDVWMSPWEQGECKIFSISQVVIYLFSIARGQSNTNLFGICDMADRIPNVPSAFCIRHSVYRWIWLLPGRLRIWRAWWQGCDLPLQHAG
jgi:hypothetical protein